MKKGSNILALFGLLLISALPRYAIADPIQDFVDQPITTKASGESFTPAEAQALIIKACTNRKWIPRLAEPGKLSVSILVRGVHYAEVSIPYSGTKYSILYVTSRELDANEKKRKIHGNYNKWVASLNAEIARTFALAMSAP
ncbi:MAG: hypothetical protein WDO72_13610 [Pseudomonadota bacterium]